MHVLLIPISYPNSYNQQSHVFFKEQARALSLSGIEVGVLAIIPISFQQAWRQKRFNMGMCEYIQDGVRVYRYQFPAIPKMWRINSWLRTRLGKQLFKKYRKKHGAPDILHVHVSLGGKLALWIYQRYQIPYVVTEHYTSFVKDRMLAWQVNLAQEVFTHSKNNIAVSNEFKSRLEQDYIAKFVYIPNIVDTNFFVSNQKAASGHAAKNFLNIGNLKPQKSQDILIRAFAHSFQNRSDIKLVIAGSGPEYSRLKKLVSSLGMQEQISFYGQADRDEVLRLMQESDCFVLSSTFETFGVVVIEAMSCGLPVIATRSGGPESIIINDQLGILCDINESQLGDALIRIVSMKYDQEYIRNYAVSHFSSNIIAARLTVLYKQVINRQ
jgi:glycosyltransferase involved in cell wall biosynthesis